MSSREKKNRKSGGKGRHHRRHGIKNKDKFDQNQVKLTLGPLTYLMDVHGNWHTEDLFDGKNSNEDVREECRNTLSKRDSGENQNDVELSISKLESDNTVFEAKNNMIRLKNELLKHKVSENRLKVKEMKQEIAECRQQLGFTKKRSEQSFSGSKH